MKSVRTISAILTAIVLGSALQKLIEGIGHRVNPGVSLLDPNDTQAMMEYTSNLPLLTVGFIIISYLIGTSATSWLAAFMSHKMELDTAQRNGIIAASFLILYIVISLLLLPHGIEMYIGAPLAGLVGLWLGLFVFAKQVG